MVTDKTKYFKKHLKSVLDITELINGQMVKY